MKLQRFVFALMGLVIASTAMGGGSYESVRILSFELTSLLMPMPSNGLTFHEAQS